MLLVANPVRRNPALGLRGRDVIAMSYWLMAMMGSYADPENFVFWLWETRSQKNSRIPAASYGLWGAVAAALPGSGRLHALDGGGVPGALIREGGVRVLDERFIQDLLGAIAVEVAEHGCLDCDGRDLLLLEEVLRERSHPLALWGWLHDYIAPALERVGGYEADLAERRWVRLGHLIRYGWGVRKPSTDHYESVEELLAESEDYLRSAIAREM